MNKEKTKNIVMLKEIPSNIIEEAIIILKSNSKYNKKKVEDYAKLEVMELVREYLRDMDTEKRKKRKKLYLYGLAMIGIVLLILIIKHIH